MKREDEQHTGIHGLARRAFMKLGGLSLLSAFSLSGAKNVFAGEKKWGEQGITGNISWYWDDKGAPVHRTVDTGKLQDGKINARVDGKWRELTVKELDQGFRDFQSRSLVDMYTQVIKSSSPIFGGILCPCIITYGGIPRGDSQFKLNGAYKYVLPCPKEEYIEEFTRGLLDRIDDEKGRLEWTKEQWADKNIWNYSILVGRDETVQSPRDERTNKLYRETHTFRNIMENPLTVLLFLSNSSFTSYEMRTICHYVEPVGPDDATDTYEKKISQYINVFAYTTHKVNKFFPAMIYYVIEAFDNSMIVGKEGMRLTNVRDTLKKMHARIPWENKTS